MGTGLGGEDLLMIQAFPKPKDCARESLPAFRTMPDGREICGTHGKHRCKTGTVEYRSRVVKMLARQEGICCLYGYNPDCPGRLSVSEATFEHEYGRGAGNRDDRLERPDPRTGEMVWLNGAAHLLCNGWKGSRKINYNRMRGQFTLPGK